MPLYFYVTLLLMTLGYRSWDEGHPRHAVEYIVLWAVISLAELGYLFQDLPE